MSNRLVLLYDSTMLEAKGVRCGLLDTKDTPEQELERWRDEATATAVWRRQGIRQTFGSHKQGRLPYFGKQVPALIVYEEGEKIPVAACPHTEERGRTRTDFTIEGFLRGASQLSQWIA